MRRLRLRSAFLAVFCMLLSSLAWADGTGEHGAPAEQGHGEALNEHGAHHAPSFEDINWYYGFLFEREGAEPSLLFRPKGMPVPFLGYVFNAFILYAVIYRFARKPVRDGLARRKATIERGMREAAEHKAAAKAQLLDYEQRLATIEEEVERVRRDMRHAGELERARILSDARARRERMERDAKLLVMQEFAAVREALQKEMIRAAMRSARESLTARVKPADHAELAELYLVKLPSVQGLSVARRGST
jgi:F0F1-type ATP synthase membrane subunit b/b'